MLTIDVSTVETIEELNTQFANALSKADISAISDMFTDDAVALPPRRNAVGSESVQKYLISFAQRAQSFKFLTSDLDEIGADMVREIGMVSFRTRGQNSERVTGRYFFLWQRVEGAWKINTFIWSRMAEANQSRSRGSVSGV